MCRLIGCVLELLPGAVAKSIEDRSREWEIGGSVPGPIKLETCKFDTCRFLAMCSAIVG